MGLIPIPLWSAVSLPMATAFMIWQVMSGSGATTGMISITMIQARMIIPPVLPATLIVFSAAAVGTTVRTPAGQPTASTTSRPIGTPATDFALSWT